MKINKLLIGLLAVSLLASCIQEVKTEEEVAAPIAGMWAEVDSDMMTTHYIQFKEGIYYSYKSTKAKYITEGIIRHCDQSDFTRKEKSRYSMQLGQLIIDEKAHTFKVNGDELVFDNKNYVKLRGFSSEYYFVIQPSVTSVRNGYGEATVKIPYTVTNAAPNRNLEVATSITWIKDLVVDNKEISFVIDKSTENRRGKLTLSYFDAEDVEISVDQAVDRFIKLAATSGNVTGNSGPARISFSIVNPIKDVLPTVVVNADWVKDVRVSDTSVDYRVIENPSTTSSRSATFSFTYPEADPVSYVLTQEKDNASYFTIAKNSFDVDYRAQNLGLGYSISNPRDGLTVSVNNVNDWITINSIADGKIGFSVAENNTGSNRVGSFQVIYDTFSHKVVVDQSYTAPVIKPASNSVGALYSGETKSLNFAVDNSRSTGTVSAVASSSFITINSSSASSVSYAVAANKTGAERTGKITVNYTVAGKVLDSADIELVQPAAKLDLDVERIDASFAGASSPINITADCPWTASSNSAWLTMSAAAGSNSAKVNAVSAKNDAGIDREAVVTISNAEYNVSNTVKVSQSAPSIALSASKFDINFGVEPFQFTVKSDVAWTLETESWLSCSSTSGSTGSKTVTVTPSKNTAESDRTGTITVKSDAYKITKTITVKQTAFSSVWYVNNTAWTLDFPDEATTKREIRNNFPVTVSSSAAWLTVDKTSIQPGVTNLVLSATNNDSGADRTATVTISAPEYNKTETISVSQVGATLTASKTTWNPVVSGGSTTSTITSNIAWSASSNAAWLTISPSSAQKGTTTLNLSATANAATSTRTAVVTLSNPTFNASKTITVTQDAFVPSLTLNKTTWAPTVSGGTQTISVTSNMTWTVSSNQTWLTVAPSTGNGNASFTMSASANPLLTSRSATVTVSNATYGVSKTISVTQDEFVPSLTVDKSSWAPVAAGGTQSVSVTSNMTWIVVSDESWLTITPTTGEAGTSSFTMSASANALTTSRSATVTVSNSTYGVSKTIAVTQDKFVPSLTIDRTTWASAIAGGSQSVAVTSNMSWTVTSDQSWLSFTPASGKGDASFTMTSSANTLSTSRTATVTVQNDTYGVSKTITVTQAAPSLTISSSSWSPNCGTQTSSSITVSSNVDWTATSNASWLSVSKTSGASGSSNITMTVTGNNSTASRSAKVTITNSACGISKTITVSQYGYTQCAISLTSAFNTGLKVNTTSSYIIVVKSWVSGYNIIGTGTSSSSDWRFYQSGSYYYYRWPGYYKSYSASITTTSFRKFMFKGKYAYYYTSESASSASWSMYTSSVGSTVPTNTIKLGAANQKMIVKSFEVRDSAGTTTNRFIGVNTNGTVGMFDTVTGKLIVGGTQSAL